MPTGNQERPPRSPDLLTLPVSAADQEPLPRPSDLRKLAEDASILLEFFSKTEPGEDEDTNDEYRGIIDTAFGKISEIKRVYQVMADRRNASLERLEPPVSEMGDMKLDSECVICYSEIADTVLIPCNHLVLCTVSLGAVPFPSGISCLGFIILKNSISCAVTRLG